MDPITALGAAGSVVGIVSFGLKLSDTLYQFTDQTRTANECLQEVADIVQATTHALNRIQDYLQVEQQNRRDGKPLQIFSGVALVGFKEVADKCLLVFWRIEATVTNNTHREFEQELVNKLAKFNEDVRDGLNPVPFQAGDPLSNHRLNWKGRIRWHFILPRLESLSRQLQHFQGSLNLMCAVGTLQIQRTQG